MSRDVSENDRRTANVIEIGTIVSVNAAAGRARVQVGDVLTPEIAVGQMRAGPLSFWWMPGAGEQVMVAAPGGDLGQGVIVCGIFAGNAPSADGAVPMIDLAGGEMVINGTLKVTRDVIADGVSLVHHVHDGVAPGLSNTGEPV